MIPYGPGRGLPSISSSWPVHSRESAPFSCWTSLFMGSGVAIHSTYWHNNYGEPSSRGCVNCSPEDAKWIFRWSQPVVAYGPGDLTVSVPGGTHVKVVEK
uniref:L,D-TPase catalytic domain-containing protein n=1 Tax=Desulfobacca acetoxidans TaxID=60893 RepID=A0A7V4GA50_9BACT